MDVKEWDRLYKIYQKKYKEKEYREKKKYGALFTSPQGGMLNKGQFKTMFVIKQDEINSKYSGTTVVKLVDEQFSDRISNKQAKVYQKALMEKTGKEYSLTKIKAGAYDMSIWNKIKDRISALRSQGFTSLQISGNSSKGITGIIAMEFFGSEI